jgi:hypothetical protein
LNQLAGMNIVVIVVTGVIGAGPDGRTTSTTGAHRARP